MSVFRLTADQTDLYRPDGATSYERVSGVDQGVQHLRTRLRLIEGEVFRDTRVGVQFFSLITEIGVPTSAIANHLASVAMETPGIRDVELAFTYEPVRGIIDATVKGKFLLDDQSRRVPIHEKIMITTGGGSIQT